MSYIYIYIYIYVNNIFTKQLMCWPALECRVDGARVETPWMTAVALEAGQARTVGESAGCLDLRLAWYLNHEVHVLTATIA